MAQSLYDIYAGQGKQLPTTAEARFADPNFASAATQAGITKDQYQVNAGNADYNTKIASFYKAPTATTGATTTPPATTTPAAPKLTYSNSPEDQAFLDAQREASGYYKTQAGGTIDEAQIRADALAQMQAEINATNQIYADKLTRATQEGTGRLGTSTAIQARRGLLGSDFGQAQTATTQSANEDIYRSIENEKQAAISALLTKAKESGTAAIAEKRAAKEAGIDSYIKSLQGSQESAKSRASNLAATILAGKVALEDYDQASIEEAAKNAGVTVDSIKTAYKDLKTKETTDAAKVALDLVKAQPASVQEYEYAKAGGYTGTFAEYQTEDANRKAKQAADSLTPYQKFQATQALAKDTQMRTENAREIARQSNLITSSYNNIVSGGDRSLNTQAIITSFNKILDPTSVVRESEYDRTAAGQSLIQRLQGKVDNITAGGAGVTEQTLAEAAQIAKEYLDNAKATIEAENQRSTQMAEQFGLNSNFVGSVGNQGTTGGVVTGAVGVTSKGGLSF